MRTPSPPSLRLLEGRDAVTENRTVLKWRDAVTLRRSQPADDYAAGTPGAFAQPRCPAARCEATGLCALESAGRRGRRLTFDGDLLVDLDAQLLHPFACDVRRRTRVISDAFRHVLRYRSQEHGVVACIVPDLAHGERFY